MDTLRAHSHQPQSIASAMVRVVALFLVLTLWAVVISIGYAYRNVEGTGLLGWIRLPAGIGPFQGLNLEMADVVAFCALFVAILLAATVQINATISAADDIADRRPTSLEQSRRQQDELRLYANQAEMSMIVSFGAAFCVLLLTTLFGLQEMAVTTLDDASVDTHGVGWAGFARAADTLLHPRVLMLWLFSFLLFLTTYASLPSWKDTGLFRRQVEDNAWEARERLTLIASEHDLSDVHPITRPVGAAAATAVGYLAYVVIFVLTLNLSLTLIAGGAGFDSLLTAERWETLLLFALLAVMVSTVVAAVMLRLQHLHSRSNALLVVSLVLTMAAVLYVIGAEGVSWAVALGLVVILYAGLWAVLYHRGADILDEKHAAVWEFLLNPPKFIIMRRYEAIRASAAKAEEIGR